MNRRWAILAVAGLVLALTLPHLGVPSFYLSLLTQTWIYAMVAMSLDLLVGFTGLVNFSQAAFFGVGAYAAAIAGKHVHAGAIGVELGLGIAASLACAAIFGVIALRAEGVGFIIITLALNQIAWGLAYQWVSVSGGDNGINGILRPMLGAIDLSSTTAYYYFCFALFVLVLGFLTALVRSPFGLVLRGVRDTPRRMRALGYNVWLYRYAAMLVAGAIAGAAGVLFCWYNQFVGPGDLALDLSTQFLIVVILGGIGTLYGQILGALIVVFLSNGLSALTQRWELILGAIYIAIVMFAPDGLVGLGRRLLKGSAARPVRLVPASDE